VPDFYEKATPRPWLGANMIHAERGDQMTPEEIGEYVAGCIRKSRELGGSDQFLFITTEEEGGPDICHVGNGPKGPFNTALIVHAVNSVEALEARVKALEGAASRLVAAFDQMKMTQAERIIVGISDAGLRTEGNAAIEALRATLSEAEAKGEGLS